MEIYFIQITISNSHHYECNNLYQQRMKLDSDDVIENIQHSRLEVNVCKLS